MDNQPISFSPEDISMQLAEKAYPTTNKSPESQQLYLNKYSFGALVMNYFYYRAMGDKLLAWLSILASLTVFFLPLLVIFPFWARRRAYKLRVWQNFGEFESAQKKWDEASIYSLIVMLVVVYLLVRMLLPIYEQALQQLGVSTTTDPTEQLNQATTDLKQELGQ